MILTTTRQPSRQAKTFSLLLSRCLGMSYIPRSGRSIQTLFELAQKRGADRLIVVSQDAAKMVLSRCTYRDGACGWDAHEMVLTDARFSPRLPRIGMGEARIAPKGTQARELCDYLALRTEASELMPAEHEVRISVVAGRLRVEYEKTLLVESGMELVAHG